MSSPILEVRDLCISLDVDGRMRPLLDSVSFEVAPGEIVGLVGESGSGKTITALSMIGLLPAAARVTQGQVLYEGKNILSMGPDEVRDLRRAHIATIFQDPMNYLNPLMTVGQQLAEVAPSKDETKALEASLDSLKKAGFPDPKPILRKYPHELSGGMSQRAMLAMALIRSPKVLIADEITTALDVTTQASLLEHLKELKESFDLSVLMITHDIGVVAKTCDRMVVMYAGTVFEVGDVAGVLGAAVHPYTRDLLQSIPTVGNEDLGQIQGSIPSLTDMPTGCRFNPRCQYVIDLCRSQRPPLADAQPGRKVACHVFPGGPHGN